MTDEKPHEWVPEIVAAKELGIARSTFSRLVKRLVKQGLIETKKDIINSRVILVDLVKLREIMKNRYQ